ncbi:MAG: universal stress protein [Nannocystaceae bacterium]|nr:universal stress protein [Nannocystaceae bacterium]
MDGQHFQRILVPVDFEPASDEAIERGTAVSAGAQSVEFSPASLRAVSMAATVARGSKGTIVMLHATPPMHSTAMYTGPVSLPSGVIEEIENKARATSLAALQHLKEQLCPGLPVEYAVGPGHPAQCVLDEAERTGADLIVMAASGRSRVARFFVGSTADRVIRESPCPVLVIPAH